jgi:hypothetical protein
MGDAEEPGGLDGEGTRLIGGRLRRRDGAPDAGLGAWDGVVGVGVGVPAGDAEGCWVDEWDSDGVAELVGDAEIIATLGAGLGLGAADDVPAGEGRVPAAVATCVRTKAKLSREMKRRSRWRRNEAPSDFLDWAHQGRPVPRPSGQVMRRRVESRPSSPPSPGGGTLVAAQDSTERTPSEGPGPRAHGPATGGA